MSTSIPLPRWAGALLLALLAASPAAAGWVTITNRSQEPWRVSADPNPAGRPRAGSLSLAKEMTIPPGNLGIFQVVANHGRLDQAFCLTDRRGRTLTFGVACDEARPDPAVTPLAPAQAAGLVKVEGAELEIRGDQLP